MATKTMPRYAVWNNKGGVGKTFLTFILASAYAEKHPESMVVVLDMCPQANVSEILLGGNGAGGGELTKLLAKTPRQTIGGYFDQRIEQPHKKTGTEFSFLLDLPAINPKMPVNLRLVAGDPSLEVQTQAMNQIAGQSLPREAWANVYRWALDLIEAITTQIPNAVFFIDCNPSFSAYTGVALVASNRLIVPCTADGSSARAIDNVGQLLYGIGLPAQYQNVNFSAQAGRQGISLPSIHLVPLNRSTQYDKKASKAFSAMYTAIQHRVTALRAQKPANFSLPAGVSPFLDIPDAHSVSVVASHEGVPLSGVTIGAHKVYGVTAQVNPEPMERYEKAVDAVIELL